jgi:RNA polymerase sigma-70 factor (ECF subfamily)
LALTRAEPAADGDQPAADESPVVALVDRAVADRDPAAFGELYDLFVDRVYRYLYFRTGQHAEAEDLTEQVFLQAWQAIGRYRWQGRPFLAWLYRLAHNVHIDHVRKQRPTMSLTDDDHPIDIPCGVAATELAQRLDADVIARALAELTAEQRQVIVLKFIDGLENDQIASIMDKREGAIRALQMRALLSLRRVLEKQGEGCR